MKKFIKYRMLNSFTHRIASKLPDSILKEKIYQNLHNSIAKWIEKKYLPIIINYKKKSQGYVNENYDKNKYIWILWWQGEMNAPEIVKSCIKQIKKLNPGCKVIILTEKNFEEYVVLTEQIRQKYFDGKISKIVMSDWLRSSILYKYGGLWCDSTIYVTKEFPDSYFNNNFFSRKGELDYKYPHNMMWVGHFIGGKKGNIVFKFWKEILEKYLSEYDNLINYFLFQYIMLVSYRQNIGNFKNDVDSLPYTNPHMQYYLQKLLNQEYSKAEFEKINTSKDFVFKLTYKDSFLDEINDQPTFYYKLVHEEL